jgi:transmembrane sensor
MQITDALIRRFLSGEDCSSEEADLVSKYLVDHPDIMKEYLEPDWEDADNESLLPQDQSADMLHQISGQVFGRSSGIRYIGRSAIGWAAAAILILIAGIGLLHTHKGHGDNESVSIVKKEVVSGPAIAEDGWQTQRNDTKVAQKIVLPDGSVVSLFAQGTIRYAKTFITHDREILLKGQATFEVSSDAAHPFVVKAGNTLTTVLGTSFNVQENDKGVTVKLYNGKVSIRAAKKDFVLSPGEQMKYRAADGLVKVASFSDGSADRSEEAAALVHIGNLVFENTALPEVMEKLSRRYHVSIQYDHAVIGKMYFTGSVLATDSLATILRVIANMNELSIVPDKDGFTLTASPK